MLEFFQDGGWSMYPITVVGLVLLYSSARYAADLQPVRLKFVIVLVLALLAFSAQGFLVDFAQVMWTVAGDRVPQETRLPMTLEGLKESTRPVILGLSLCWLGLIFVATGIYRAGQRELAAARG